MIRTPALSAFLLALALATPAASASALPADAAVTPANSASAAVDGPGGILDWLFGRSRSSSSAIRSGEPRVDTPVPGGNSGTKVGGGNAPDGAGARPVPEPVTLSLLGVGGLGLAFSRRRRRDAAAQS